MADVASSHFDVVVEPEKAPPLELHQRGTRLLQARAFLTEPVERRFGHLSQQQRLVVDTGGGETCVLANQDGLHESGEAGVVPLSTAVTEESGKIDREDRAAVVKSAEGLSAHR